MSTPPPLPHPDTLRRQSRRAIWLAGLGALLCLPYLAFSMLWSQIASLSGGGFVLAAAIFGLLIVSGPLLICIGVLAAVFLRVEACTLPGESPRAVADWLAVAAGLLLSFAPAVGGTVPALQALATGGVRYKFPATTVMHSIDPLGYWQGVAFWFMGAAALALLACLYWRSRWQRRRSPA